MSDSNIAIRKKRGRPRVGQKPVVSLRLHQESQQDIDEWRSGVLGLVDAVADLKQRTVQVRAATLAMQKDAGIFEQGRRPKTKCRRPRTK
jgi:hypothetical protein